MRLGQTVLVRAFGGEPVEMVLVAPADPRHYAVRRPDGVQTINLPIENVFSFERITFSALKKAFDENDGRQLGALWHDVEVLNKRRSLSVRVDGGDRG